MNDIKWKVYRFECQTPYCGRAFEIADHQRRDPANIGGYYCSTCDAIMEFVGSRPLYEVEENSVKEHVRLAERHAQAALNLAYGKDPQKYWTRIAIGRAQSILISLITNNRLR